MSKNDIIDAAANHAHVVADKGSAAWTEAVERLTPLLEQAAEKVSPYAQQAKTTATRTAKKAAGFAADQVERIQPALSSALDKVPPAVDKAQKALQDSLVPHLVDTLRKAAEAPSSREAKAILDRLDSKTDSSLVALKGQLAKSDGKSKKKTVAVVLTIGAVLTALAVAIKTFLGSKDDWAEYEPDEPYVYPDDDPEIDAVLGDDEPAEEAPYGEGSYRGPRPPEGYAIKGNERSMKFHVPGSAGYARTNSDVWFASEEAAEAAGFARSQR